MKVKFHLFSSNANCKHCVNMKNIPAWSPKDRGGDLTMPYCFIICAAVELDYYCSFYRIKTKPKPKLNETKNKTILPTQSNDSNESRDSS